MHVVQNALHSNRTKHLEAFSALVLNADFRPLEYLPLSILCWEDAVKSVLADDHVVVHEHEVEVRSPSVTMRLPSVVALRQFVPRRETPKLSRNNLLVLRDRCSCAYCGQVFELAQLTLDHVIPKSQKGPTRWENLVSACLHCNQLKANRTPEKARMPLLWRPWLPSLEELARANFFHHQRHMHDRWIEFLPFAA